MALTHGEDEQLATMARTRCGDENRSAKRPMARAKLASEEEHKRVGGQIQVGMPTRSGRELIHKEINSIGKIHTYDDKTPDEIHKV